MITFQSIESHSNSEIANECTLKTDDPHIELPGKRERSSDFKISKSQHQNTRYLYDSEMENAHKSRHFVQGSVLRNFQ